jgi:hypothetical protein
MSNEIITSATRPHPFPKQKSGQRNADPLLTALQLNGAAPYRTPYSSANEYVQAVA